MLKDERGSHASKDFTSKCGREETPEWGTVSFF